MSFCIVNLSSSTFDQSDIAFFTAGPDQVVICAPFVHLTAVVTTEDLGSHETLWEQVYGSPIVWLGDPYNTLEISYSQTANRDDKRFRFWVDKGTEDEIYEDVIVYGNITDFVGTFTSNPNGALSTALPSNEIRAVTTTLQPAPLVGGDVGAGKSLVNSQDLWLTWSLAGVDLTNLRHVDVYENSTGFFELKAKVPVNADQVFKSANANYTYKLVGVYVIGGVAQAEQGTPLRLSPSDSVQILDEVHPGLASSVLADQTRTYTTRTKISYSVSGDSVSLSSAADTIASSTITVISRTLKTYSGIDETIPLPPAQTNINDLNLTYIVRTRLQVGG